MKRLFLFALLFSPMAFADSPGGFFEEVYGYLQSFWDAINNDVPSFFQRMVAYAIETLMYIKFYLMWLSLDFAWGVAKAILDDFQISELLLSLFNQLPDDLRQFLIDIKLFDAIGMMLNAHVTRFVLSRAL
ncbi:MULTISPECIES: DUF2523 family protein [Gammaproteobacteria]|uniref:DUF2523 family protein n=1 Tax=Gammaproteobacteria TaxID=1236 RepID=UPI003A92BBD9